MLKLTRSLCTLFILIILSGYSRINAQPYVEIVTVQSQLEPAVAGDSLRYNGVWLLSNFTLPIKIDSLNIVAFTPGFELRSFLYPDFYANEYYRTVYLPLSWIHQFRGSRLSMTTAFIYRHNASTTVAYAATNGQAGGALYFSYVVNPKLTLKGGAYYNHEFFGDYWLALAGWDYRFSKRLTSWGLLPREAAFDYTLTPSWHAGINFKGVTESYRTAADAHDYLKITEGIFQVYNDWYLFGSPFTFSLSAGATVAREQEYRSGDDLFYRKPREGLVIQAALSYRFITDKNFKIRRTP